MKINHALHHLGVALLRKFPAVPQSTNKRTSAEPPVAVPRGAAGIQCLTRREIEIELLRRKIAREAAGLYEHLLMLQLRWEKQCARHHELGIQETLLKTANAQTPKP